MMFRLPVCPHCHTVYRYKDVWKEKKRQGFLFKNNQRDNICYHCQEKFRICSMPGTLILILLWMICSIGTNLLLLSRMTNLNLIMMMASTLLYAAVIILLYPFFVKFKKIKENSNKMNVKR